MRRYRASKGSCKRLRFPVISVAVMLGVGGWIANASWSSQDPDELQSTTPTARASLTSTPSAPREPATAVPVPVAAPKMAALPPLPAPAKAETSGSSPSATAAVGPNKMVVPPKPKEPSVLATMHAQIVQMKAALKLTRDQEPYWPPVEA